MNPSVFFWHHAVFKEPQSLVVPVKWINRSILLILVIVILAFSISAWKIYSFSMRGEESHADAAIVLGAASWGEEPSPVFKERINHAILLYNEGYVKKIIFTGDRDSDNEDPASVVARNYSLREGVPRNDILIETESATTMQNLVNAKRIASKMRLNSFLIVSDPLHMKRAMIMAKDLGMEARQSPTRTTRYRGFGASFRFMVREVYFYLAYSLTGRHL